MIRDSCCNAAVEELVEEIRRYVEKESSVFHPPCTCAGHLDGMTLLDHLYEFTGTPKPEAT